MPGGKVELAPVDAAPHLVDGGSQGWCGSGKLIQQNQSSSGSSESSQAMVRSATQSVWYMPRGMGLCFTSGASVSPPAFVVEAMLAKLMSG